MLCKQRLHIESANRFSRIGDYTAFGACNAAG